jgi:hypothetical protein
MADQSQSLERTNSIDRRGFALAILCCAAAAGLALRPSAIQAMPFGELVKPGQNDLIEKIQAVVVAPRRRPRRRVWRCWWRRGRRVCGWRWV